MTEQLKESLSAVMDGEADEFEIRRVLNEAANDAELRGVWERYHLVRSVMRGEGRTLAVGADKLSARFWTLIDAADDESSAESADRSGACTVPTVRDRWATLGRRVAGVAVAAGVAAVVIVGFRTDEAPVAPSSRVAIAEPVAPAPASIALFDDEVGGAMPAALDVQRAHAYMLHHARHVALNNRSVVPFVRVAAFESK